MVAPVAPRIPQPIAPQLNGLLVGYDYAQSRSAPLPEEVAARLRSEAAG